MGIKRKLFAPLALVVASTGLVSGCSRVKMLYVGLEWLLEREVDRYLDLDGPQEKAADKVIDDLLAWHRTEMLPRYAKLFTEMAEIHRSRSFDQKSFARMDTAFNALYEETIAAIADRLAQVLVDIRAEQINHLERTLNERRTELVDELSEDKEEVLDEQVDKYVDFLERFTGDLTKKQHQAIAARVRIMHDDPGPWLGEQGRRHATLVTELRKGLTRKKIAVILESWWLGKDSAAGPEFEKYLETFRANFKGMLFDLQTSLTDEQRKHLVRELGEYAQAFNEMARGE